MKSLFEIQKTFEFETKPIVKNLRRPETTKVNLNFFVELTQSGKTIFINHKEMIDFQNLSDKDIDLSEFPTDESLPFNIIDKSIVFIF